METTKRRIFTGSENLALKLFKAGEHGEEVPNRYTGGVAWLFDVTEAALQIAEEHYHEIGKELPHNIQVCKALYAGGKDHE